MCVLSACFSSSDAYICSGEGKYRICGYISYIQHKSHEIVCSPEDTLFHGIHTGISLKDPPHSSSLIIWDESATNLEGFKCLCWINERYASFNSIPTHNNYFLLKCVTWHAHICHNSLVYPMWTLHSSTCKDGIGSPPWLLICEPIDCMATHSGNH